MADTNVLRPPYDNWDKSKVKIDPPICVNKRSGERIFAGTLWYIYIKPNGNEEKAPLRIEFPMCNSEEGVVKTVDLANRYDGIKPTKGHHISCKQSFNPEDVKLREILNDLYIIILQWMEAHGKDSIREIFYKEYKKPKGEINFDNTANHLLYPIHYEETTFLKSNGNLIKIKDLTRCQSINLKVYNRDLTSNEKKNQEIVPMNDIMGKGFSHTPIAYISLVYIDCCPRIKMILESTTINKWIIPRPVPSLFRLSTNLIKESL